MTTICIAGATGWTGRALVDGVLAVDDLELRSAVARATAGQDLGTALGREQLGVPIHGDVGGALEGVDVLIDYTSHEAVKANTLAAIENGVSVVIGTSGLTAADFEEIGAAERLAGVRAPVETQPPEAVAGPREARGATVAGTQVHSLRLPSFVVSTEIVFGLPDERLSIRHDAGGSATPYVAGTLLAARAVAGRTGLTRGLDTLLVEG